MQRLNRTFFFIDDYLIDITTHENIFALDINISQQKIVSLAYIKEKIQHRCLMKPSIEKYIETWKSNDSYEANLIRICTNTEKIKNATRFF